MMTRHLESSARARPADKGEWVLLDRRHRGDDGRPRHGRRAHRHARARHAATSSPTCSPVEPYVITHGQYRADLHARLAAARGGVRPHGALVTARRTAGAVWGVTETSGPLAGVRVVDLGQYLAGPLCALLLADQGADVIRVDPPGGPRWDSPANAALLRGRRHVILDLHDGTDRRRAGDLIASADVVVENFRPGVAARLGVGSEAMLARAPQLVYCSLPGFGAGRRPGRSRRLGGRGDGGRRCVFDGRVGVGDPGGRRHGRGARVLAASLASLFGALEGAMAVVASLIARERDGLGQPVEVPLFDALFEAIGLRALSYERNGPAFTDFGSGFYHCADGTYFTFIASWFHHLERFVEAAGVRVWVDDGVVDYDRLWADPARWWSSRPGWRRSSDTPGEGVGGPGPGARVHRRHAAVDAGVDGGAAGGGVGDAGRRRRPGPRSRPRAGRRRSILGTPRVAPGHPTSARLRHRGDPRRARRGPAGAVGRGVGGAARRERRGPAARRGSACSTCHGWSRRPPAAKLLGQLGAEVVKIDEDPEAGRALRFACRPCTST